MLTSFMICAIIGQMSPFQMVNPYPGRYTEDTEVSDQIRHEQREQIEKYINRLIQQSDDARDDFIKFDYSSVKDFMESTEELKDHIKESIGYPPPEAIVEGHPEIELIAQDPYADIYRMYLPVLPGVEGYSLLFIPRGLEGKAPVMICQHGGAGSPEVISEIRGQESNYGWMVHRALDQGFIAWVPGLIFEKQGEDIEGPDRLELDQMARYVGTSIFAIELWKIKRGIDVLQKRKDVDPNRIAMMGLSYGGLYTLYASALDPRIKVAVSSCIYSDRKTKLHQDWSFFNFLNEFTDPDLVALICPRPIMIEVSENDPLIPIENTRKAINEAEMHYEKLGLEDRFRYVEFEGEHEFYGKDAYDFVNQWLGLPIQSRESD